MEIFIWENYKSCLSTGFGKVLLFQSFVTHFLIPIILGICDHFWFFFPRKVLKLQLHHQKVKFVIICFWLVLIPLFVNDKSVQPLFSRCLVWLHISDCKLFMRNAIRFLSRHCFGYKVPLVLTFALSWSENCWNENFRKGLKVEIFLNIQMIYLLFIK